MKEPGVTITLDDWSFAGQLQQPAFQNASPSLCFGQESHEGTWHERLQGT